MDVTKVMRKQNECINIKHSSVSKKRYIWGLHEALTLKMDFSALN